MAKRFTDQEKIDYLERFAEEREGCFYSKRHADEGLGLFTGVKGANTWIKQFYGISPDEFYTSAGLMMNKAQLESYRNTVFAELEKRFQGKSPVRTFEELEKLEEAENPDLDLDCFRHTYPSVVNFCDSLHGKKCMLYHK